MKRFRLSALSLRWTLLSIEWTLLLGGMISALIGPYFHDHPDQLPAYLAYCASFFVLSVFFPVDRPLWERRAYIALEVLLIVSALWVQLWFDVLLYLILVKSCFLFSRRDVLITVVLAGATYLPSSFLGFSQRINELLYKLSTQGPEAVWNLPTLFLSNVVEYISVSTFAVLLGLVLVAERKSRERAEMLSRQVETLAANLERTRIAREIHDCLGHALTTLDVQLEVAQRLRQQEPEQAQHALDAAKQLATQCLRDVRRALQTIHQSDFSLTQALRSLVDQVQQHQPFVVQFDVDLPPLPPQTSHQLYCIVQEGLTNIQKHAAADRVTLRSWATPNDIQLELSDDGKGFDPNALHPGFGLRGMRERVQLLGGKLKLDSVIGQGTWIWVTIPRGDR